MKWFCAARRETLSTATWSDETKLGVKVYAGAERALADIAKSVHFHDLH